MNRLTGIPFVRTRVFRAQVRHHVSNFRARLQHLDQMARQAWYAVALTDSASAPTDDEKKSA